MKDLPHHYHVTASAEAEGLVSVDGDNLPAIATAPPPEFGGPEDRWSPETLLTAAVANCFILSFRAIARASKLPWQALECDVEGVLDRTDRKLHFTEFVVRARLQAPADTNLARAQRLLEKAEQSCLITNSLTAACRLETEIVTSAPATLSQ